MSVVDLSINKQDMDPQSSFNQSRIQKDDRSVGESTIKFGKMYKNNDRVDSKVTLVKTEKDSAET